MLRKIVGLMWICVVCGVAAAGHGAGRGEAGQGKAQSPKACSAAAKWKLADELCECAVAAKMAGVLAIKMQDAATIQRSSARTQDFLRTAKRFASSQYVEAKYKSLLMQFFEPETRSDERVNDYILGRAHMCAYIVQNPDERLRYWDSFSTKRRP